MEATRRRPTMVRCNALLPMQLGRYGAREASIRSREAGGMVVLEMSARARGSQESGQIHGPPMRQVMMNNMLLRMVDARLIRPVCTGTGVLGWY